MTIWSAVGRIAFAVCAVVGSTTLVAQQQGAARQSQEEGAPRERAGQPRTEQERSGEALFFQNCTLCHTTADNRGQKALGILAPTQLIGLFKSRPGLTDTTVRQFIMVGSPGKMPGFRYTLSAEDLDDLIAYLKIR